MDLTGRRSINMGDVLNKLIQVRWHASSSFHFASVDYDGVLSLWDVRSSSPLSSRNVHSGKALCLDWVVGSGQEPDSQHSSSQIFSGGSDCCLSFISMEI